MSVYKNMGMNLRELCKQKPSISFVCKELGINRQQFAKYMNGENFPRRKMLSRICEYFDIEEIELFTDPDIQLLHLNKNSASLIGQKNFQEVLEQLHAPQETALDDGLYMTHFRSVTEPDWVIKSVTAIKRKGEWTEFRRLTGYNERKSSAWRLLIGSHRGLVLNRRGFLYFAALDQRSSQTPSLAIMRWAPTDMNFLSGRCIALTKSGADVCHIVMEQLPNQTGLRSALKESGAVGFRDTRLSVQIRQLFTNM